jgi:hypothetical protein
VSLRRAAAAGVLVLAVALAALLLTRGEEPRPVAPHPNPALTPTPTTTPTPTPAGPRLNVPTRAPSLAVGITESNPNLIAALGPVLARPWPQWRRQLVRMRPVVYRIVVPWSAVQRTPGTPPNFARYSNGCIRDKGPCASYAGLHDQLRAVALRRAQALLVFVGLPPWAMAKVPGCRLGTDPAAGMPRRSAMPAFRRLVEAVLAEARSDGVDARYVSPWNEPNHPAALAPQRSACDAAAPSLAVAGYTMLARATRAALDAAPGDHVLVLGETAGIVEPTSRATGVAEMIRGLPRGLVCAARVWSQHAYIGGTDPVPTVRQALDTRGCPRRQAIWISETGVGPAPGGLSLARGITSEAQGCRLLHQRLLDWYRDRRVTLAIQYTFREDDLFPTGLVTTDLTHARPALKEWQAWGGDRAPGAPPPRSTCSNGG